MLEDLTPEEIDALNQKELKQNKRDYEEFVSKLKQGICDICGRKLTYFEKKSPCMHWLLRPIKFKKKHLPLVFSSFGYYRIQSYLRWIASSDAPFKNINDLTLDEEGATSKKIENTIVYKDFEWSFSSSQEDFKGHENKKSDASKPHYHFQMRINKKPFISYNDFHIPFDNYDRFYFDVLDGKIPKLKHVPFYGSSIQDAFNMLTPEDIIKNSKTTNPEKSAFRMQTLVTAKKGKSISGNDINKMIKRHKETGESMASILSEYKDANVSTIISPGDGVPEVAKRTPRRKQKS